MGDLAPFLLEMGWREVDEPRGDIGIKDAQCLEGGKAGDVAISEGPCEACGNPPDGSRLIWIRTIDMRSNTDRVKPICDEEQWKRSL